MDPLIPVAAVVAASLALVAVMRFSQRALLSEPPPPPPPFLPPVSILKPLKGVDSDLEANLRSIFQLDYPRYEVILGALDADDPALEVALAVSRDYPHIPSRVLADPSMVGPNPKVSNLANLARRARHSLMLISDSNIRVRAGYLRDLVAHRAQSGAGLVWSLFRGTGERGLGAVLEALQLNAFVMGGVSAISRLLRLPCAVGKSMLLDRYDLERIGGFESLSRYLAEDQVCAEELTAHGRPVVVTGYLIDNVLGRRTLGDFAGRHLRWARIRRHVNLAGYLGEALLNPVFLALVGAAALRTRAAIELAAFALLATALLDLGAERAVGIRRPALVYPFLELALSLARGLLWFPPLLSRSLVWRGNLLRIGSRSRIDTPVPLAPANPQAPAEEFLESPEREVVA